MGFFITMFICNLLMPFIMIIGGFYMFKFPPKDINSVIGYRTKMSKKNKDTWAFAHDYCGRLWIKLGLILLIPSIVVQLPFVNAGDETIGNLTLILEMVQLCVLLGSIVSVENVLKRTFHEKGVRR